MPLHRRALLGSLAAAPLLQAVDASAQGAPRPTGAACTVPRPQAATRVSLLAYRVASLEYFAAAMRACAGGTLDVEARLVSFAALLEQSSITLAGGGESPFDILHSYNTLMWEQANRGWLRPLDDLAAQYRDEYGLADFPAPILAACGFDAKLYGLPFQQSVMVGFANTEAMDRAGAALPKTIEEMLAACERLKGQSGLRAPIALACGGTSGIATEFHNALMAAGGAWLDGDGKPAFNSDAGRAGLDSLRRLIAYCPGNALQMSNDDVQVAMQQGQVAMTNLWITRAAQMDDRAMSRVPGKVAFFPAPAGAGGRPYSTFTVDMFVVPKGAKDPELSFRIIADALRADRMRGAAALVMAPRESIAGDAALNKDLRWIPAGTATLAAGAQPAPRVPFFASLREVVGRALQDGLQAKQDSAAILVQAEENAVRTLREQGFMKG